MRNSVSFTRRAEDDLIEHFLFIRQDSEQSSDHFWKKAWEAFAQLSEMPKIGSPQYFDHSKLSGIRLWTIQGFKKHLIYYHLLEDKFIEILRILHASRDLKELFEL